MLRDHQLHRAPGLQIVGVWADAKDEGAGSVCTFRVSDIVTAWYVLENQRAVEGRCSSPQTDLREGEEGERHGSWSKVVAPPHLVMSELFVPGRLPSLSSTGHSLLLPLSILVFSKSGGLDMSRDRGQISNARSWLEFKRLRPAHWTLPALTRLGDSLSAVHHPPNFK